MYVSICCTQLINFTSTNGLRIKGKMALIRDNRTSGLEMNHQSLLYYHTLNMNILCSYSCRCVFIQETQNLPHNVSKQDHNDIFLKHMGLHQTEYNVNVIF